MPDDVYQKLIQDFEALAAIAIPFDRQYELVKRSKAFNEQFDLSPDDYQQLFELYLQDRHTPDWLERTVQFTKKLEPIAQALRSLTFLAVLFSAIQFVISLQAQRTQLIAEKWETVASDLKIGGAKREAIEYLHDRGEILSNLEAIDTQLSGLNLPGSARLQESKFTGANLYQAYLVGANLYRSDFASEGDNLTNLDSVNFQDADLRGANFRGANLQHACFEGANLEAADFTDAYLVSTDFRGARNLEASQILQAKGSYERGLYDQALSQTLKLSTNDATPSAGCRVGARSHSWWQSFLNR
ncbi:MAG: pentapeptide repeat-containing protein [Cyanobacteria bacterium P01_A01_bin.114]